MLIWFICVIALIFLDQLSKWLAVIFLEGQPSFYLIPNILRLSYVENRGAAFGMLADNRWIFLILSALAILCILVFILYTKPQSRLERAGLALIFAGGIGNMIDRIILGYVIDFIDFCAFPNLWRWVFNIADSCVCIGVGLLLIYVLRLTVEEYRAEKKKKASPSPSSAHTPASGGTTASDVTDTEETSDDR